MQIARNEFACKFQGPLQVGQKVTIRFWWESGLSSASRNYLTTFCRPFVYYAYLRLCSEIIHLDFYAKPNNESFLAYFIRILNSCVV